MRSDSSHYSSPLNSPSLPLSPAPSSASSRCSSAGSSASSVLGTLGMSISLEELMFVLVGDYHLTFLQHGRLVTCGTMDRPDAAAADDASAFASPTDNSSPGPASMVPDAKPGSAPDADLTVLPLTPFGTAECVCKASSPDNAFAPLAEPRPASAPHSLESEHAPTRPTQPLRPATEQDLLSLLPPTRSRSSNRSQRRTLLNEARKTFVLNAFPLDMDANTAPLVEQLFKLISQYTQAECKRLVMTTLVTLQPKRRLTHPYRTAAPDWWPSCVRYVDSSHLLIHERQALLFHLWFSDLYSDADILRIEPSAAYSFSSNELRRIFHLVLRIRHTARMNAC